MSQELKLSFSFHLGRVTSPAHQQRLLDVAHWLDQNKFSCTFSVIEGVGLFDISPHNPEDYTFLTFDEFRLYAAEHVIHNLARALGAGDAPAA